MDDVPTARKTDYGVTTISTRLFMDLPSSDLLSAMGFVSPYDTEHNFSLGIPSSSKIMRTDNDLACARCQFEGYTFLKLSVIGELSV